MDEIIIVKNWDQLPRVVHEGGTTYWTHNLRMQHRQMYEALVALKKHYPFKSYISNVVDNALEG